MRARGHIMRVIRDERGFTLLEAMVSIGVLALLSAFILEMFIVSAGANRRAQAMDEASAQAVSVIDLFQAGLTPEEFLGSSMMDGASIAVTGEGEAVAYTIRKPYPDFDMELQISNVRAAKDDFSGFDGALYELTVRAVDTAPQVNMYADDDSAAPRILVEYTARKYFSLTSAR